MRRSVLDGMLLLPSPSKSQVQELATLSIRCLLDAQFASKQRYPVVWSR
jgi:hypothetical protein